MLDVKKKQIDCLRKLLSFNDASFSREEAAATAYKVLILDEYCRSLVAPLLKLNELRSLGVTLHLSLESDRQPIHEVPAIYLVQSTTENVNSIVKDFETGLYGEYRINFVSRISRPLLEKLAEGAAKANVASRVTRVEDQYMSFLSLERGVFTLSLPSAYMQLNDPTAKDFEIESLIEVIVNGLFCCFVTLGAIPVIRCPPGGAAEHIASVLDDRIRSSLKSKHNLFSEAAGGLVSSLSRPLLVLFDRNFDLSMILQHTWSYKPLVQDLLDLHLNRVSIKEQEGESSSSGRAAIKATSYDVDDTDFFWEKCGSFSFPKIAEEVEIQLQNYKKAVENINKQTSSDQVKPALQQEEKLDTQNLMAAVSSLPELTERKKILDKHTSMATVLLDIIKGRSLDQFYNLEEDIVAGKGDFSALMSLLDSQKGTDLDKLRLACVWLLASNPLPNDEELRSVQKALGEQLSLAFNYVRTLCTNKLAGSLLQSSRGLTKVSNSPSDGNLLSWAEKNFSQGLSTVKNLLTGARRSPIVAALEALIEGRTELSSGVADFKSFDPRSQSGGRSPDLGSSSSKEIIVFMVGGGNYLERESLELWAASNVKIKQVVYGTTEMLSAEKAMDQLKELAMKSSH
eukprot:g5867.t1